MPCLHEAIVASHFDQLSLAIQQRVLESKLPALRAHRAMHELRIRSGLAV